MRVFVGDDQNAFHYLRDHRRKNVLAGLFVADNFSAEVHIAAGEIEGRVGEVDFVARAENLVGQDANAVGGAEKVLKDATQLSVVKHGVEISVFFGEVKSFEDVEHGATGVGREINIHSVEDVAIHSADFVVLFLRGDMLDGKTEVAEVVVFSEENASPIRLHVGAIAHADAQESFVEVGSLTGGQNIPRKLILVLSEDDFHFAHSLIEEVGGRSVAVVDDTVAVEHDGRELVEAVVERAFGASPAAILLNVEFETTS